MEMDEAELRQQETDGLLDSHVQPDQSQVGSRSGTPSITGDPSEEENLPKGAYYHLNSKKLKTKQLKRVAQAMDLAVNASAEGTRRMIEGKLREMDRDPLEVQVVVQEMGEINLDHKGKFLTVEAIIDDYVPHIELRSALPRSKSGTRELSNPPPSVEMLTLELEGMSDELRRTKMALEEEQTRVTSQTEELAELREALQKDKQKVKRVWREKCEKSIVHEEQLEEKELRIRELQRQ